MHVEHNSVSVGRIGVNKLRYKMTAIHPVIPPLVLHTQS